MKKEDFCEVFGDINENYIQEARVNPKVRKPLWLKRGALAACLCLVVVTSFMVPRLMNSTDHDKSPSSNILTAPGFLTLTASAASLDEDTTIESPSEETIIMQEGIEVPITYNWNPAMSSRPGIPLNLSAPGYQNTTFEVSVDGGELLLWEDNTIKHLPTPFYVENGTTIYWSSLSQSTSGSVETMELSPAYIDIVILEDTTIVGYAVVKIELDHLDSTTKDPYTYYATLVKSVSFPKVNGSYQIITYEYVRMEMEQLESEPLCP